jgi:RNase_H superfamily
MEDHTPICLDPSLLSMVAFDIETEGFNPLKQRITAAAVYDGNGLSKVFVFKGEDQAADLALREEFLSILDAAPRLCSFNGIRFDIPYIIKHWKLDPLLAERWVRKTLDIFEACKLGLKQTFKLSQLLAVNNMESKTGSGLEAVGLARDRRWEELGAYCLQDTRLTYLVTAQMGVMLPLRTQSQRVVVDRSHPSMFRAW